MQVSFKRFGNANTTKNQQRNENAKRQPQLKDNKKSQEPKLLIYAEGQNIDSKPRSE